MKKERIRLFSWDWTIYVFISCGRYRVHDIITKLISLGCEGRNLSKAYRNLISEKADTGLTYSNKTKRASVMVVGYASSAEEFFNSLLHEMRHVEEHIATADGIDPYGEDVAYLIGDLSQAIYPLIKHFLCDCCRNKKGPV